jgi:HEAT repeat protein
MPSLRPFWQNRLLRPLGLGLLLLAVGLRGGDPGRADSPLPDPVDEFRKALNTDTAGPRLGKDKADNEKALEAWRAFRRRNLREHAARMRSLGDLSRALLLSEWDNQRVLSLVEPINQEIRGELRTRFQEGLSRVLESGTYNQQIAAAALISETAGAARGQPQGNDVLTLLSDLSEPVIALTSSPDPTVRAAASIALSRIDPRPEDKAVGALEKELTGGAPASVREAAARAMVELVQVMGSQVVPSAYFREPLKEPGKGGLPKLPPPKPDLSLDDRAMLERLHKPWRTFGTLIVRAVSQHPRAGLLDPDVRVRRLCANACQQFSTGFSSLIRATPLPILPPPERERPWSDEDRKAVERERQRIQDRFEFFAPVYRVFQEAAPALAQAIDDEDAEVRLVARRMADDMASARQFMRQLLDSFPPPPRPNPLGRRQGAPADGKVTGWQGGKVKTVTSSLVTLSLCSLVTLSSAGLADDPDGPIDPLLREPPVIIDALVQGLCTKDVRSRLAALEALESMGGQAAPVIPALIRALQDENRFVRWAAARTLGKFAPRQAEAIVAAEIPLLCDLEPEVRGAAAAALERFGDKAQSAVDALTKTVEDIDSEVRIAAMKALVAIGSDAASAVPAIAKSLSSDNPRVRRTAADTLGRFGRLAAAAVPELRKALTDTDQEVRRAASEALIKVLGD